MYVDPKAELSCGDIFEADWLFDVYVRNDTAALFRKSVKGEKDPLWAILDILAIEAEARATSNMTERTLAELCEREDCNSGCHSDSCEHHGYPKRATSARQEVIE